MTKSPWIVVKWVAIAAALALLVWIAGKFAAAGSLWAVVGVAFIAMCVLCLLYTSPSPRDRTRSRMPSSA